MAYIVEKSDRSSRDIEEAFVYIAEDNLDKAIEFLVAIEDSLTLLSEKPRIGRERYFNNSKLSKLRIWRVKRFEKYFLIYQIETNIKRLRLMRLVNSNRDFQSIEI